MLLISLLLLFVALNAFSLSLSLPSSVTAGQTTSAVWTRNGLFDPTNFVLLLRDPARPPEQGVSNFAKSGGRQSGQIFFTFPNEGTFVLEAYTNETFQQLLTTSDPIQVLAAAVPISGASLLPLNPEVTGFANSASAISLPTSQLPFPSSSSTPSPSQVSTSTEAFPSSLLPSNLQSNATPRGAIIGGAVSGALIVSVFAIILLHRCRRHHRLQRSIFFRDRMIQQGSGGASWTALTSSHGPNLDVTLESGTMSSMSFVTSSGIRSPPRSKFIELIPGRAHSSLAVEYARSASPASNTTGGYSGYTPSDGTSQIGRAV